MIKVLADKIRRNILLRRTVPTIPSAFRRSNLIFVHVPKAAGSTINLSLFGHRLGHRRIESYWRADPDFTNYAFKFAFVRHPYFRFVSAYRYLLAGGMSSRDAEFKKRHASEFSSLHSMAEACELKSFRDGVIHLRPQFEFLSLSKDGRYKVFMDYVGKTEFLNDHLDIIRQLLADDLGARLELAKKTRFNAGGQSRMRPEIDEDVFRRIRRVYEDDFEIFGYDEWGTVERAQAIRG